MNHLLFSIIIPVYNYGHTVKRAILSVLEQDGDDYEIIIVDDGSTDDTPTVLKFCSELKPAICTVIHQENKGAASARNTGIEASQGKFLIFLDADDALIKGALKAYRSVLEREPHTGVILAGHESVSASGKVKTYKIDSPPPGPYDLLKSYLIDKTIRISNGAIALHRNILADYRFPEELGNSEDIPVFAYGMAHYPVSFTPLPVARIYKHSDSLRHNLDYTQQVETRLVDEIFNHMPESVQPLRRDYLVQCLLSLSRTCFMSGDSSNGRKYFTRAVKLKKSSLCKFSYTRKFIRSYFQSSKSIDPEAW